MASSIRSHAVDLRDTDCREPNKNPGRGQMRISSPSERRGDFPSGSLLEIMRVLYETNPGAELWPSLLPPIRRYFDACAARVEVGDRTLFQISSTTYTDEPEHLLRVFLHAENEKPTHLVLSRSARRPSFGTAEAQRMRELMPRLQRGLTQRARHEAIVDQHRAFLSAFENLPFGVVIVGKDAQLVRCNRVARKIIEGGAGLALRNGRLRARLPEADRQFHKCLQACLAANRHGPVPTTLRLPKPDGGSPVIARIGSIAVPAPRTGCSEGAAIVFLHDPERARRIDPEAIREAYALTRVESELTTHIAQGRSVEEAAELLRVSRHTARKYLQQVFAKTGVSRQVDLVRLILTGPVFAQSRRQPVEVSPSANQPAA